MVWPANPGSFPSCCVFKLKSRKATPLMVMVGVIGDSVTPAAGAGPLLELDCWFHDDRWADVASVTKPKRTCKDSAGMAAPAPLIPSDVRKTVPNTHSATGS